MCTRMSQLDICCQRWGSRWPHSSGRTQYLRNTKYPFWFFHTCGKLAQRSAQTSDGWTGGQKKELGVTVTLSQSHFGLKDISGEAWTKAFKMCTIRRGGEAGVGVTLHWKSERTHPSLPVCATLSAPLTYSIWYICTFFTSYFPLIFGVFVLRYLQNPPRGGSLSASLLKAFNIQQHVCEYWALVKSRLMLRATVSESWLDAKDIRDLGASWLTDWILY